MGEHDVAVLGVGMHPWGKWGRNFVDYGIVAARAALDDAGLAWRDVEFVSGADTVRNGYPGYVAGATFAQALVRYITPMALFFALGSYGPVIGLLYGLSFLIEAATLDVTARVIM